MDFILFTGMAEHSDGCVRQETVAKQGYSGELNVFSAPQKPKARFLQVD
jgi:hypothetical protein